MKKIKRLDHDLSNRADLAIAHAALTNSKRPSTFVRGIYPQHLKEGNGCHVKDTLGNDYIDFICGLGSNLLGYANDDIVSVVSGQLRKGSLLSLGTELEVKAAERLKEFFPFVERVRFLKTGSEACTAALTIARAFTGNRYVLSDGYHGWSPEFTFLTPPANGVVEQMHIAKFTNLDQIMPGTAAVIIEPVITDFSTQRIEWLRELRKKCNETGTLLIFDEVITGLRWLNHSVAREYDVIPDIICLGKAIGGGLALSAVCGRKDVMEADYFVSSTFAGDTLALASCLKTFDLVQNKFKIDVLWQKGAEFMFKFNELWRDGLTLDGYPTRSVFKGSVEVKALFMQECCEAGILVGPSFFLCFPHMEIMDEALSTFKDILARIRLGEVKLRGEMPVTPHAQKTRSAK